MPSIPSAADRLKALTKHFPDAPPPSFPRINVANHHHLNPTVWLPRAARVSPNAPAVLHQHADGKTVRRNYKHLSERAVALAHWLLQTEEWKRGERMVGIISPNTPMVLELYYAIPAAGGKMAGINYRLTKEEVQYIIEHSGSSLIFIDKEYAHLVEGYSGPKKLRVIEDSDVSALTGAYEDCIKQGEKYHQDLGATGWTGLCVDKVDENETFGLFYTSGTTSKPKGVEFTYRGLYLTALSNIIEGSLNIADPDGVPTCRYLWILPFFHAGGWTYPWAVTGARGVHICLRKVDYPLIWRYLLEEGVTHYCAAPVVNQHIVASPLAKKLDRNVNVIVAASAPSAQLFKDMAKIGLKANHVYGLTETYGPVTRNFFQPEWRDLPGDEMYANMARQGSSYLTGMDCRVVETGKIPLTDVPRDGKTIGEIVLQGNLNAKGYYNNPKATEEAFAGGAYHTGDLAIWWEDGSVLIMDRAKDIIITGGENVSSIDVEGAILTHPSVLEVAVIAIPDSQWGEVPMAFVVPKEGKTIDEAEVLKYAKGRMAGYKVPKKAKIVKELPKTSTGKVQKHVLRKQVVGK